MTEQDAARDAAFAEWKRTTYPDFSDARNAQDVMEMGIAMTWQAAWAAGVAHGRAEAWREIEIIAGDSLPRDWGRIAREVREVRG